MNNEHRHILEPYKGKQSRYTCPSCGKRGEFVRYIDTETGEHLAEDVGRCNREDKCGWHYKPHEYFHDHNIKRKEPWEQQTPTPKRHRRKKPTLSNDHCKPSTIPFEQFKQSLLPGKPLDKIALKNNFVSFLLDNFGKEVTRSLINNYFIGTSKLWKGANIFWQIDFRGNIRTGKVMLHDPDTGKRDKKKNHWIHAMLYGQENFNLNQCLFFEHLLKDKSKPVAIAEGQKTAIVASVYFPQFIWIAAGNKGDLKFERCLSLAGRNVILFPDLGAFEKWKETAKELSSIAKVTISDYLEKNAPEEDKYEGLDLADYLLAYPPPTNKNQPLPKSKENNWFTTSTGFRVWDPESLLRLSGLDFLCDYETEAESTFEDMAIKNPKLFRLRNKLGLKPDE